MKLKLIKTISIFLSVFSLAACGKKEPAPEPVKEETEVVEEKEQISEPVEEEKPLEATEESLKAAVEKIVDSENLELFNYYPDTNFTLIKFKCASGWNEKSSYKSMRMDIKKILKKIQEVIDTDVDFNVTTDMKDKSGNVSEDIVLKATFKNSTIKNIDFDNIIDEDLPRVADEWWIHPTFK